MLPTEHLVAFALTTMVLVAIPGPSVLFTIGRAIAYGRRVALLTVVGNTGGLYLQVVAVAVGLGALVASSVAVFTVVKLAGAAYLVYLGVQAIRHRRLRAHLDGAVATPVDPGRALWQGFVVGTTNPKMIVFLAAALPQVVDRDQGGVTVQMLLLGALVALIALASDSVWAATAGTARAWFARSPRRLEVTAGAGGFAMIGVGVNLALTGKD